MTPMEPEPQLIKQSKHPIFTWFLIGIVLGVVGTCIAIDNSARLKRVFADQTRESEVGRHEWNVLVDVVDKIRIDLDKLRGDFDHVHPRFHRDFRAGVPAVGAPATEKEIEQ